ncbi:MAG: FtsW/RodA/SpoVE family cell cycle protein [Johnsonella sp.]|nr:FtsW/RodA/SpoVE family cell cycle protein [Johnsonella sp.]
MFNKYTLKNFDFRIVIYVIILNIIGLLVIASASNMNMKLVNKQLMGIVIGLFIMTVLAFIPYDKILKLAVPIYLFCLAILILVLIFGVSKGGAKRWIVIPVLGRLQPSEFVKGGLIISFSWLLAKYRDNISNFLFLLIFLVLAAIPYALVLAEPDLSTTLILIISALSMVFVAGISYKWVLGTAAVGIPSLVIFIELLKRNMVSFLRPYQINRILAWVDKEKFAEANIQQKNSIMAIGSGQLLGKGLFNDTLASVKRGNFLVEEQTDFIFAVVGEELGFVGSMLVIILLSLIIFEFLYLAVVAKDMQGRLLCTGFAAMLAFQFFTNIAVATGIFPNTGLPLPFISYGVSSLLSIYIWIGIVLNVGLQRNYRTN